MEGRRGRSGSPRRRSSRMPESNEDESIINSRQLEALGRTVHATASQLMSSNFNGSGDSNNHHNESYRNAIGSVHRSFQRPSLQRSAFSLAKMNPREIIRSNFNTSEIEQRAITYIPDDLLRTISKSSSSFSLFEGFQASRPEDESLADRVGRRRKGHGKHGSKGQKLLEDERGPPKLSKMRNEKHRLDHRLEMMGIRKTMCASEIREIDVKIANLNTMRKVVLDRLAGLESEEHDLEQEVGEMAEKLEAMMEEMEDEEALTTKSPGLGAVPEQNEEGGEEAENMDSSFMSESVYGKLPKSSSKESPKSKRRKTPRRISMPVLHEHMEPGSRIRELQAHNDMITALDFDAPFGTMVTAALDDTVRVWDLNAGRCMGMLEGHLSSVRCLQVEENIVATGSMDASIKLWDLSQADYVPQPPSATSKPSVSDSEPTGTATGEDLFTPTSEEDASTQAIAQPSAQPTNSMEDCHLFTLSSHVAEITALNFRGNTLVSGSADKTLRQWDLETGRCMQTLDVLWAAAQASSIQPPAGSSESGSWWRPTSGRLPPAEADFVGALQVFETALACGTADGMVRLWDLRSGMVHRSLVGHTGPITALQFDDVYLVTGSQDRSIRIWDLRTGGIHDAFAYDQAVTSMMFDTRRIVSATGEDTVKVYDKADGRHWDCGPGASLAEDACRPAPVERVRIKEGYMVEGRKDGIVGVWSC